MKINDISSADFNRREFLKGGSVATVMTLLGGVELTFRPESARAVDASKLHGPTVNCGIIGLGAWGRWLLTTLQRVPEAKIAAVCDKYPAFLRRSSATAPGAKAVQDYRQLLEDKDVHAVFVATPTHQHRAIVLEALAAGKHVYCEAPLAHTIEDARAIALAAKNNPKLVFQSGLQRRADPQLAFLLSFVRSGATGKPVLARGQWFKKQSWRATSPNPEREQEMNWRLRQETSTGLVGEIGVHQIDLMSWFHNHLPTAVTGFGSIRHWNDGRDVADTVMAMIELDGGVQFNFQSSLANSFESSYEILYGSDAAVLVRDGKAWLFKEVDAPLLGWEVYARKDVFYNETGISLVANASKSAAQGKEPGQNDQVAATNELQYALENFLTNVGEVSGAIEDFASTFNVNDKNALVTYLKENVKRQPAAGYREAFEATVAAIKTNEAIVKGTRVTIDKALYELA